MPYLSSKKTMLDLGFTLRIVNTKLQYVLVVVVTCRKRIISSTKWCINLIFYFANRSIFWQKMN
ncbi:hypothetical protein BpHYR1_012410 [Brachionus plicatilis]|uniref:Uncharacterized protein n=1 Tax=Brachionus plicatilis TaxID=10195 RepID=A0A3M7SHD1_BRAPC|nr:hypothetical protein BpHYR1_012410 [Brachionus plicatilis]